VSDLKHDLASLRLDEEAPKSHRGLWIGLIVFVVLGAGAVVAWRASATLRAMEVETVTPSIEQSGPSAAGTPILTASGYIVARREAIVSSKIQGRLSELHVEEGSVVKDGEVLARLENTDYIANVERSRALVQQAEAAVVSAQAQVQRSAAELAEARRQFGVNEKLSADKLVPVDTLDATRSAVKLAEAALAQARADEQRAEAQRQQSRADLAVSEAQLANTVIRAPFAGTVVRKMAEVGESVAPIPPGVNISTASGAIVALADLATLEMEADVSESNVARLHEGQPAEVTVEAFPDRKFRSVLRQVIPTADRTKATVLTKVTLLEKDDDLKPEMSAKVTFLEEGAPADTAAAPQKPLILVPQTAVVTRGGSPQVFEIVDGRARARKIATGGTRRDMLIVTDGLAGTEKLVARPEDSLNDGTAVKPKGAQ
jgi:RND family efflux transporter MFP subunit